MRIFVTGAAGFIGSALVPELLQAGHQVLGLTRSEAGAETLRGAGAEVMYGNTEDLDSLRDGAAKADGIIHLAFNHDFSQFQKNCDDDRKAIEAMGEVLRGSKRPFVVTSGTGIAAWTTRGVELRRSEGARGKRRERRYNRPWQMRTTRLAILLVSAAWLAQGEPPEFYKHIAHVVWLVRSIDAPLHGWSRLGLSDVHDFGKVRFQGEYRGRPVTGHVHLASGHLGSLAVDMLAPQGGDNAFNAFLSAHGDGIFSIVYKAVSEDEIAKEVARMAGAGVKVLQRMQVDTDRGRAVFTFFDTEPRGKYVLGLVHWPGGGADAAAPAVVSHIAFVIREAKPVGEYWQQLGFPEMPVSHASPREDSRYHGMPLLLSFEVGWHRYTHPTFEWIIPPQEPANCYADFLKQHGEGVHHLGLPVDDLEAAIARYQAMRYKVVQSGAWGSVGKKSSGQYGYMATDSIGGVTVELIHAYN